MARVLILKAKTTLPVGTPRVLARPSWNIVRGSTPAPLWRTMTMPRPRITAPAKTHRAQTSFCPKVSFFIKYLLPFS